MKEISWKLYRECKSFLEESETEWKKRKLERDLQNKKKERIQVANSKQEQLRQKVQERKLQEEIEKGLKKLPTNERKKLLDEEEKRNRLEINETKKTLWKLRSREKKFERIPEHEQRVKNLEN